MKKNIDNVLLFLRKILPVWLVVAVCVLIFLAMISVSSDIINTNINFNSGIIADDYEFNIIESEKVGILIDVQPSTSINTDCLIDNEGDDINADSESLTFLSLYSSESDLYIIISDDNGNRIENTIFTLSVSYPSGENCDFLSEPDGTCYLVNLEEGTYKVKLNAVNGYLQSEEVECYVNSYHEREVISNIQDIVEISDDSQIDPSEVKTGNTTDSGQVVIPEIISSTDEIQLVSEHNSEDEKEQIDELNQNSDDTSVPSDTVNEDCEYIYGTGPNGYLLYYGTDIESDVLPVEENGMLKYGERNVISDDQEDNYFEKVPLFNEDGTPNLVYEVYIAKQKNVLAYQWVTKDNRLYFYDDKGEPVTGLKYIDGKLTFFDSDGSKTGKVGVDVSSWNGDVDWYSLKSQGIEFAVIRLGGRGWGDEGKLFEDTLANINLYEAKAAGIEIGAYFYSTAITVEESIIEASLALKVLNGFVLDLPLYIDVEFSNEYPNGRSDLIPKEIRTQIVEAFCDTVSNSGYKSGVYSGQYFYNTELECSMFEGISIWLASYTTKMNMPRFDYHYNIWQITDAGILEGSAMCFDIDLLIE